MGRSADGMLILVLIFLATLSVILLSSRFYRWWKKKLYWEKRRISAFQELETRFQERFPNQPFYVYQSEPFTIFVPPKHPAVQGLRICDEGHNIMVEIGPFSHEHFLMSSPYSDDGREDIVIGVLIFVEEILKDEIEFYGGSRGGGHRLRGNEPTSSLNKRYFGKTTYVWSGPIEE